MKTTRDGRTPETAFIIEDSSGEMTVTIGQKIERLFGGRDGDYFVYSETTQEIKETGKRYKVLCVEDSVGGKHLVYFEIG